MRSVCLTMRHKKGILESNIAKAQLKAQKNYSIRDLNYIYSFFSFLFFLFQQFFYHDFPKTHQTTTHRKIYKNCLVCDTCIRELMVLDVPPQVSLVMGGKQQLQLQLNSFVIQLKLYAQFSLVKICVRNFHLC